jgi:steroid delta-isomerase-like uncharacterized protein
MSATTTEQANTEIVRAFIEAFWNGRRVDDADRFLAPGYVDYAYTPGTTAGLKQTAGELAAAIPDHHHAVEAMVAEGDKVVARLVLRGTHGGPFRGTPPTGNPVEVRVYREYRVTDGKIAEHWALLDTAALLRQIGARPAAENACNR